MNQRIAVRSIIKRDGKILILKRASGRQTLIGKYELPGGRVDFGEQPEESLMRHIKEETGLSVQTLHLSDVFTYVDADHKDIQYAVILYAAGLSNDGSDIRLGSEYDHYSWERAERIRQETLTELSGLLLNIHENKEGSARESEATTESLDDEKSSDVAVIIYSDGGSRGNPGPSAAGYVIIDPGGRLIFEGGSYLGITTNNQAEYHGVHLGLEKARELGVKSVEFRLDSLLVVNQLNGTYVIRNRELWPIHERIRTLIGQFDKVTFRHVKRELNQQADGMVNKILDTRSEKKV
jgi:mutator protein MutT